MVSLFIGLNALNMLVLASVVTLGLLASGTDGTKSEPYSNHIVLAIFAGMLAVFVHLTTFTYFIATTKWLAAATDKADLDPQRFIATARHQKRRVFKLCMLAVIMTMLAMFSGAGSDAAVDPRWQAPVHYVLAIVAVMANLLCAAAQYGDVRARGRLMNQALGILSKPQTVLLAVCLVMITTCSRTETDPEKATEPQNTLSQSSGTSGIPSAAPNVPLTEHASAQSGHEPIEPPGAPAVATQPTSPDPNTTRLAAEPIPMPVVNAAQLSDNTQPMTGPATTQPSAAAGATPDSPVPQSAPGSPPLTRSAPDITLVDRWLGRIELEHDRIKTLSASLTYDRNNLALGDRQRRLGTLIYVAGPPPTFAIHLDRMIVNKGKRDLDHWYIFDGRYMVERINKRKQFIRRELRPDANLKGGSPLAIGASPLVVPLPLRKNHLMAQFFIEIVPTIEKDPTNTIHFRLTPKPHHKVQFNRMDIWHDRGTLLPVKALTLDKSQYESEIWIKAPVVNKRVNTKVIDTTLPTEPGWQIEDTPLRK